MSRDENSRYLEPSESAEQIRDALARVVASDSFVNAERLKAFLIYVVEETLEGRAQAILGKTIAQDVYDRDPTAGDGYDNVVRVDARRLRRKLKGYYETAGAGDPVRIRIDSGGYAPKFESHVAEPAAHMVSSRSKQRSFRGAALMGSIAAVLVVVVLLAYLGWETSPSDPSLDPRVLERRALSEKSAATVQAANFCDSARGLLFPIAHVENQNLATEIFRQAIKADPDYACGYAGAAHSLATLSVLSPRDDPASAAHGSEATTMAERAVGVDPTSGWSHSAAAWSAFARADYQRAVELSDRAVELSPADGNVLDFGALIAILTGHFDEARARAAPERPRTKGSHRFARRNLFAVASFHLGDYQAAIGSLQEALESGDPVSELTLTFLAASHQGAGHHKAARELVEELAETWPGFRPDLVFAKFYADPALASQVTDRLREAGWRAPDP